MGKYKKESKEEFKELKAKENENIDKIETKNLDKNNECDDGDYKEDDEYEEKIAKGKKAIMIIIILILSSSIVAVLLINGYEIVNFAVNKVSQSSNQSKDTLKNNTNENIQGEESVQSQQVDINIVYEEVHRMANTIIIPEDGNKWGEDEITKERIEKVLYELNGRDDYLNKELNKWNNSDFSNGVKVHNYVWSKLGGTIGKAKSLNDVNVQKAINLLNN